MASVVAKASTSGCTQVSEKASRNKRKFRAEVPLSDHNKIVSLAQTEYLAYEFSAEKFDFIASHEQTASCDMCCVCKDHSDSLKLDLGLSSSVGPSEVGSSHVRDEIEGDEFQDADWNDLTETQLEELVLNNLDTIFKSAIKKIVACGYTEDVATKAVMRSGLCYGRKDTVSNIVDNTLAFLRNSLEIDPSSELCFEDLHQLEKYILAELICVLRAVRPFFSTGDAMWCLLICDMNVAHACAMDGDPLCSFAGDAVSSENSSNLTQLPLESEVKKAEGNAPKPTRSKPVAHNSLAEAMKKNNTHILDGLITQKEIALSKENGPDKSLTASRTSYSHAPEEKPNSSRKAHCSSSKRESILRQKSLHLEKSFRTYGCKGTLRSGKLSGMGSLSLDKKLKSVAESAGVNLKGGSLKVSKENGGDIPQDQLNFVPSGNCAPSLADLSLDTSNSSAITTVAKISTQSPLTAGNNTPPLSVAETELSLSMPTRKESVPMPLPLSCIEIPNCSQAGIPFDKSLGQWVPRDKKDEMILKLVPRARELQNQLQEWTEWANQKVMQAARRLGKDKAELKTLRQEKEEVERLKKEKQSLEENTIKKLSEMENALCKASGQVERANSAVRRLEVENSALRKEMEAAKIRATESATSCLEVSEREKKTVMKFQSWEKHKAFLQEELVAEKRNLASAQQNLANAKENLAKVEAKWKQEEKAKQDLLLQASSIRKEREQIEALAKAKEDSIKSKAESNLQKLKDDIKKLEKEISQLRLKTDSSKIAALRRGIDGSYASRVTDNRNTPPCKEAHIPSLSEMSKLFPGYSVGGVKRERECVMCLSEEMSVVFLPCAHQVVCVSCNELHEKQGMKECPSCRSPIQRRINVCFARS